MYVCWDKNVALCFCLGYHGNLTDFCVIACWIELHKCILRPFDYTAFAVSGKVGILQTGLTTPSWVAVATPTDRPKSVCNHCVIIVFGVFFCVVRLLLDLSLGVGAFVMGFSQISSFFSCFQAVVDMDTAALTQLLRDTENYAHAVQQACQRHLDERNQTSEAMDLLRLYHSARQYSPYVDESDKGKRSKHSNTWVIW